MKHRRLPPHDSQWCRDSKSKKFKSYKSYKEFLLGACKYLISNKKRRSERLLRYTVLGSFFLQKAVDQNSKKKKSKMVHLNKHLALLSFTALECQ